MTQELDIVEGTRMTIKEAIEMLNYLLGPCQSLRAQEARRMAVEALSNKDLEEATSSTTIPVSD